LVVNLQFLLDIFFFLPPKCLCMLHHVCITFLFFIYCRYSYRFFISMNNTVFFPQLTLVHAFKNFATISKIVVVLSTPPTTYMLSSQWCLGVEGGDRHGLGFPMEANFGDGNALHDKGNKWKQLLAKVMDFRFHALSLKLGRVKEIDHMNTYANATTIKLDMQQQKVYTHVSYFQLCFITLVFRSWLVTNWWFTFQFSIAHQTPMA
jgi:hypothetical protein